MVRLTATCGAVIMRLKRDDAYISAMLEQFRDFYRNFVQERKEPPKDFYTKENALHGDSDKKNLVKMTKSVAASATLLEFVDPSCIQRRRPGDTPLLV